MTATPQVLLVEFRTANQEQAEALFTRLQALAAEIGVELTSGGWVDQDLYDADDEDEVLA